MKLSNFEYISWEKLHQLCFELAERIQKRNHGFDKIVAISRGGLVVARILSDFLQLPISHMTIVAYQEIGESNKPLITEGISVGVAGNKLLLVDEIVDKGRTLIRAKNYLANFGPKSIYAAVPIVKPLAQIKPDFSVYETDKWVIFPYEVKETIGQLVQKWQEKGYSHKEVTHALRQLGFAKKIRVIVNI